MMAASMQSELDEQRTRANMWFRRAGELVAEVGSLREQVSAATAVAATVRTEATEAKAEAAHLSLRCETLSQQRTADEQRAQAEEEPRRRLEMELLRERGECARAATERDDERRERQRLASELEGARAEARRAQAELDGERRERERIGFELTRQQQRADSLQLKLGDLEAAFEQAVARRRRQHETAPVASSTAAAATATAAPPLATPASQAASAAAEPSSAPPTASQVAVSATAAASGMAETLGMAEDEAPHEARQATERALSLLVRGVMSGELQSLVDELRVTAVEQAEAACNSRVATLEAAVSQLLASLDSETHRYETWQEPTSLWAPCDPRAHQPLGPM